MDLKLPAVCLVALLAARCTAQTQPHTSFQTPTGYRLDNDLKTDAVIVYSSDKDSIQTWQEKGYVVQTMYGFRTGDDYIKDHPDEGQTDAAGKILDCGPGSYYMVPTQARIDAALRYFREAIKNGTSAVCPEEPEFFARAGYSEAFKREWREFYGEPWQDQTSSIEARYKSERLKAHLEWRMVKAICEDAARQDPGVIRMVACHSPVSYYAWGIVYPHWQVMQIPELQEVIGQVWTGTARTPCKYEGAMRERTFENGYLEYSSLFNQVRGTGRRLWFLMDPLEDNPDRTMQDYRSNYHLTLLASLMFPEVDAFEVLPWPTRIFGRVPDDFATEITTIIRALGEMHAQKECSLDTGTPGIGTFVADSMGWQRGAPHPSNMDSFYGITLPLLMKGIPVQVLQLERVGEPGYLDDYRVLLLTYDILKPLQESYNVALADWVKKGGILVFFGGSDAYNALPEWWRKKGFASPQEDLFARCGVEVSSAGKTAGESPRYQTLLEADKPYRKLENRGTHSLDLTQWSVNHDEAHIRFADRFPEDGWGPYVAEAALFVDGVEIARFTPGSEGEKRHMAEDSGSSQRDDIRFADGQAYWVYRFKFKRGSNVVLKLDMGNQFLIQVAAGAAVEPRRFVRSQNTVSRSLTRATPEFRVPRGVELTHYSTDSREIYHTDVPGKAFFEHDAGKGKLIFCGIQPSYFALSAEAAQLMREITRYACECAKVKYVEHGHLAVRRGKYLAVRTLEGRYSARGRWVDLLDPTLPLIEGKSVPPWSTAFLSDVSERTGKVPRLLFSSSKVEQILDEDVTETRVRVSGPLNVKGVCRFWTSGKKLAGFEAFDSRGGPVPLDVQEQEKTVLTRYDSLPDGVIIGLSWR